MNEEQLAQKILDYIENWYKAAYVGRLFVNKNDGVYKVSMGIPSYLTLTSLAGDFSSDEDFLKYVFEEIRKRNYMRVEYYRTVRSPNSKDE